MSFGSKTAMLPNAKTMLLKIYDLDINNITQAWGEQTWKTEKTGDWEREAEKPQEKPYVYHARSLES